MNGQIGVQAIEAATIGRFAHSQSASPETPRRIALAVIEPVFWQMSFRIAQMFERFRVRMAV